MSHWFVGVRVPIDDPLGREVRRWRVAFTRKRLRLIERADGQWGVLWQVEGAQLRVYPARTQAEDVCARLMAADDDQWVERDLPAQWWA